MARDSRTRSDKKRRATLARTELPKVSTTDQWLGPIIISPWQLTRGTAIHGSPQHVDTFENFGTLIERKPDYCSLSLYWRAITLTTTSLYRLITSSQPFDERRWKGQRLRTIMSDDKKYRTCTSRFHPRDRNLISSLVIFYQSHQRNVSWESLHHLS
jgi:hypothetical protein